MASKEQLRKIALYCDKYNKVRGEDTGLKSSSHEEFDNCTRCSHYNKEGRCELDLIDKVLSSMAMELDFKS